MDANLVMSRLLDSFWVRQNNTAMGKTLMITSMSIHGFHAIQRGTTSTLHKQVRRRRGQVVENPGSVTSSIVFLLIQVEP